MYEIKSKKTGKVQYIDEMTYEALRVNHELQKYNVIGKIVSRTVKDDIIQKKITGEIPNITKHERKREKII